MPQVKGKFITIAGTLMSLYKEHRQKADHLLFKKTGKHYDELEPEGFYDVTLFDEFMHKYAEASITGKKALLTLGRQVFPLIKNTQGLPPNTDSALTLIRFSAKQFVHDHQGLPPIKIIRATEGNVILHLPNIGYDCFMVEGVYLGILEMFGLKTGQIEHSKCVKKGDRICEFAITW